jgi:pimeloyl-ACP methyl ester carboxylesterase
MPHAVSPDGTPIAYEAAGTGRPIVLVGGAFQTRDDPLMTGLASALAERFTVVRYDRRGRGGSGDAIPYRDGCEEDDLSAVINTTGGQSAVPSWPSKPRPTVRRSAPSSSTSLP